MTHADRCGSNHPLKKERNILYTNNPSERSQGMSLFESPIAGWPGLQTVRTCLFASKLILDKLDQRRRNRLGHKLVALRVRMDSIPQHAGGETSLTGAVGDNDWGVGCAVILDPPGDGLVDGVDGRALAQSERNDLVDLQESY